jgi:hypothetical protein
MTESMCADCYWDADSERKRILRSQPKWVFGRAYSSAIQLLGKTHEEAVVLATQAVDTKFGKK